MDGLFLVRKKDTAHDGSFKMKPVGARWLQCGA